MVDLACRRFEEEKKQRSILSKKGAYREIVKTFVASGNVVNDYDIKSVERSRFAVPIPLLNMIEGETKMGWTGFVLEMKDGKQFSFGTAFHFEFFNLPERYRFEDVKTIHNHSQIGKTGKLVSIKD